MSNEWIVSALKEARERQGLSQRKLSRKVKIPQSHISKIESGEVDLQISSLIELSRALDLEVMLIPRSLVLAVEALQRSNIRNSDEQIPMYRLDQEDV